MRCMYVKMNRFISHGIFFLPVFVSVEYASLVILSILNKPYVSQTTYTGPINARHKSASLKNKQVFMLIVILKLIFTIHL